MSSGLRPTLVSLIDLSHLIPPLPWTPLGGEEQKNRQAGRSNIERYVLFLL